MPKGQSFIVIIIVVLVIAFLFFFVLRPSPKAGEAKFKNDVVTIENYFVTDLTPYETQGDKKGTTNIQFDIVNNGDQSIPYTEVDFFDLSGFGIEKLDCGIVGKEPVGNKCIFSKEKGTELRSLDSSIITINLKTPSGISSPTPYTISFAIRYVYFGFRDVNIPAIDGITVKQPTTSLQQGSPSIGPVVLDIEPALERDVIVEGKTVKQQWAISGKNAFPFTTKFKFSSIGTVQGKIQDINITEGNVKIRFVGLSKSEPCQFDESSQTSFVIDFPQKGTSYAPKDPLKPDRKSQKPVVVPFDVLFCTFKPTEAQPEYVATISASFAYKYEFIRTQDFVVQPLLK